jgi:hypothetical protein
MKKFVLTALCALISVSAFAQGSIQLSNIGKGIVTIDGAAAGPGAATVQYADANNNLLGGTASILGAGFFSNGSTTLDGLTGEVSLKLAGWVDGGAASFSDPFTVTLGGAGTPPSPAAALPASFAGLDIATGPAVPEPSTIALAVLGGAALFFRRRK